MVWFLDVGFSEHMMVDQDRYEVALDLCYKMFDKHAIQRVQFFNFFVLILIGLINASVLAIQSENVTIISALGVSVIFIGSVFWRIENRNYDLIKISERSLDWFQKDLSKDFPGMNVIEQTDKLSREKRISYKTEIEKLLWFNFMIGAGLLIYAYCKLV